MGVILLTPSRRIFGIASMSIYASLLCFILPGVCPSGSLRWYRDMAMVNSECWGSLIFATYADLGIGRRRSRDAPQVSRGLGTPIALTNGLERSPLAQERSINEGKPGALRRKVNDHNSWRFAARTQAQETILVLAQEEAIPQRSSSMR